MLRPLLLVSTLVASAMSHEWGLGACPDVRPMPGLDIERFLGSWHVMAQTDTGSECYTLDYARTGPTSLRVTKARQHPGLRGVGLQHNTYAGSIDIPDEGEQGRLRVKWPLNLAGKSDYIIFDTDYTEYAGIYDCQDLPIGHRRNAAILSRNPTLSPIIQSRLRTQLANFGVTDELDDITHGPQCQQINGTELSVHLDPDTVPDFFSTVADGITDTGVAVIDGIVGIADSVIGSDTVSSGETFNIGEVPVKVPETFNIGEVPVKVPETFNIGEAPVKVPEITDDAFRNEKPEETFISLPDVAITPEGVIETKDRPRTRLVTSPTSTTTLGSSSTTTLGSSSTTTLGSAQPKNLPEEVDEAANEIELDDDFIRTVVDIQI